MHLYLIRHAHAVDGDADAVRPLSPKGLKQVARVARRLAKAGEIDADEIWHSPLVRARETAGQLARQLELSAQLVERSGLRPGDDPAAVARRLGDLRHPVAVVGHEPQLSALASLLVTGAAEPSRFILKKCAVLRLDRGSGGWAVRWQIAPELL